MEDFKNLFKLSSIYDTIFIKIETEVNLDTIKNVDLWVKFMEETYSKDVKLLDVDEKKYFYKKSKFYPEFSEITSISWGIVKVLDNGDVVKEIRKVSGNNEKEKLEYFFKILELYKQKKINAYVCGFNILNYEIPFLVKRGLKYGLDTPKIIKTNLSAKPWEYMITDINNISKVTGIRYTNLEIFADFLNVDYVKSDDTTNPDEYTSKSVNTIIDLYLKLRKM